MTYDWQLKYTSVKKDYLSLQERQVGCRAVIEWLPSLSLDLLGRRNNQEDVTQWCIFREIATEQRARADSDLFPWVLSDWSCFSTNFSTLLISLEQHSSTIWRGVRVPLTFFPHLSLSSKFGSKFFLVISLVRSCDCHYASWTKTQLVSCAWFLVVHEVQLKYMNEVHESNFHFKKFH